MSLAPSAPSSSGARSDTGSTRPAARRSDAAQPSRAQAPSRDEVARRAYELYESEGCQDGRDVEYWLRAEAELSGRSEP